MRSIGADMVYESTEAKDYLNQENFQEDLSLRGARKEFLEIRKFSERKID